MALNKEGYKTQFHGTARIGADTDSEGFLLNSQYTPVASGVKNISFNMGNSDNDASDNADLVGGLIVVADGIANYGFNNFTVKWSV